MSFKRYSTIVSLLFPIIFIIGILIALYIGENQENAIVFLIIYSIWIIALGVLTVWHIITRKYARN